MFELPEVVTLAKQVNQTLQGKAIVRGELGNMPHKFVWYNQTHEDFAALTTEKTIGAASARGRWLLVGIEPGYVLMLGECGGKIFYHPPEVDPPQKFHLRLSFEDGSAFSVTTQMWGAMELYSRGLELERQYIKNMRTTPVEERFTFEYFTSLIDSLSTGVKRSAKGLLTQDQLIPGLGNSIAQDILFRARLSPRRSVDGLDPAQRRALYDAIIQTVREVIDKGGRNDELDLYGKPGGYPRLMDRKAAGKPCPVCGTTILKMAYLGGSCYYCPSCQV
jgi:formamidopyrimidine-DNA glycosylase